MIILQVEHKVPDFAGWKKAFDKDPINRKKSGVKRYRVYRPADDINYVIIDMEFESMHHAASTLAALRKLWGVVEGRVMINAKTRILDMVESKDV